LKVIVAENHEEVSRLAADILEETVRANPCCTLGLATGSSPVGMYRELSRRCREEGLDFSRVHSVNLDEYVGLAPTHEQSYRYFMDSNLFDHINIDKANTYVAKGLPPGAICNPSYQALTCAISPDSESSNYFFVTDTNRFMLYAETRAGHERNVALVKQHREQEAAGH